MMNKGITHFLTPQELQRLNLLLLESRDVVEGNLTGRHSSPHRGTSTEFADHRQYYPGDDLKHMDWKVVARTEKYYVRRYEDETNLRVYLVLDRSASMAYGSGDNSKFHYACRLAAALGYIVLKSRDAVGLHLYSDDIDRVMPARHSFGHLNNMMTLLQDTEPSSATETAPVLHKIADSIQRRALVILISDLIDNADNILKALAHFRKVQHDVIMFQVLDPAELDLSLRSAAEFEDMESGERLYADPKAMASEYNKVFGEFLDTYRRACSEMRVDYRLVNTSNSLQNFIRAYLEERKRY